MGDIYTHFPFIYQGGHWISTAAEDRREQLKRAADIAAKVGLMLIGGWLLLAIWFCV